MNQLKTMDRFPFYQCCLNSLRKLYITCILLIYFTRFLKKYIITIVSLGSGKSDQIRNHINKGRIVGCVCLDLSKALCKS